MPTRRGACGRAASFAPAAAATAAHAVCQLTRNDLATDAVERSQAAAANPWRNRPVSRLRAGICAVDSVKLAAQPGVSQRNRRLLHQHHRTGEAVQVPHPLDSALLDPRRERATARARRLSAPAAHLDLQHTVTALLRGEHLELVEAHQHPRRPSTAAERVLNRVRHRRTRRIGHVGVSLPGQPQLPDSRGPDTRARMLSSHCLPHQPRRA